MLVIRCRNCSKRIIWDDFQAGEVICPKCNQVADVAASLADNIERRERELVVFRYHCPACRQGVNRRIAVRCPACGRWIWWRLALHIKTQVLLLFLFIYLVWGLWLLVGMVG